MLQNDTCTCDMQRQTCGDMLRHDLRGRRDDNPYSIDMMRLVRVTHSLAVGGRTTVYGLAEHVRSLVYVCTTVERRPFCKMTPSTEKGETRRALTTSNSICENWSEEGMLYLSIRVVEGVDFGHRL